MIRKPRRNSPAPRAVRPAPAYTPPVRVPPLPPQPHIPLVGLPHHQGPARAEQTLADWFRTCHHMYIGSEGMLVPLRVNGYLTDPAAPLKHVRVFLTQEPNDTLVRLALSEQPPPNLPESMLGCDFYTVREAADRLPLNVVGGIVAVLFGRVVWPMHGPVAVLSAVGPDGLRRKLTMAQKDSIADTTRSVVEILAGRNPLPHVKNVEAAILTVRMLEAAIRDYDEKVRQGAVAVADLYSPDVDPRVHFAPGKGPREDEAGGAEAADDGGPAEG